MKSIPPCSLRGSRLLAARALAGLALACASLVHALPALLALAALAVTNISSAQTSPNAFGTTTLMPVSTAPSVPFYPLNLTADVGTPFSVNLVFAVSGSQPYGAGFGIDARIKFDPTKLQVVSVAAPSSSPWTTPIPGISSGFDNVNGTVRYAASGGAKSNSAFAVATIVFNPIAAGTSALSFLNVNEYLVGYGPFGVNGLAVNGSVTVNAALPTQTLTILGGSGSPGDFAANVEYFNPSTLQWQSAFLANYAPYGHPVTHPWGNVPGTTRWINYRTAGNSDADASGSNPRSYLYRVRFTVPADAIEPKMTFSLKADNFAQVAINGVNAGGLITGTADLLNVDAVFSQNVMPGENTITLNIIDTGGLNGFNFRIDLSMKSSQPLEIVPVETDNTPPVITTPGDLTREATGSAGAVVTFITSAVDDVDGPVSTLAEPSSGSVFPLGTTAVDVGAYDSAGNMAFATFGITVRDTTPPVITAPANITAEATSGAGAAVSYTASATDLVDGSTAVSGSPASGSTFALGMTTVALSSSDTRGNASSASFKVTVQDTIAPALVAPANQVLEATSAAGATATFAATATDAVGVTSITSSAASGSTFPLGVTTVTVTASDAAGNASSGSFTVTVKDTTAPALNVPASQILEATSAAGATAMFAATATDAVGVTSITSSAASGSTFLLGTTTVTVTARDAAGNATSGSFTVTVQDTTAPVITSLTNSAPALWPPNHKMVAVTVNAAATDLVGLASLRIVSVTSNEPDNGLGDGDTAGDIKVTGALTVNLRAERSGGGNGRVYTITVEARDAAGNTSTRSTTVTVPKSQGK